MLVKKISVSFLTRIVTVISAFIASVLISRYLGPEKNGIYRYLLLLITSSYLFTNLGIFESTNQLLASLRKNRHSVFFLNLIWSAILVTVVLLLWFSYDAIFGISISKNLVILTLILAVFHINRFSISFIFLGIHKINQYNLVKLVDSILNLIFIGILYFTHTLTIAAILKIKIITTIVYIAISIYFIRPKISLENFLSVRDYDYRSLFRRGINIYISNLSTFLNYRVDMFVLKVYHSFSAIGLYSIAVGMIEKIWIIPESVRDILYLEVASKRKDELFAVKLIRITMFIIFLICIILAVSAKFFIPWLYGIKYADAVLPMLFSIPGILFFSYSKLIASYFVGIDKVSINTKISVF